MSPRGYLVERYTLLASCMSDCYGIPFTNIIIGAAHAGAASILQTVFSFEICIHDALLSILQRDSFIKAFVQKTIES